MKNEGKINNQGYVLINLDNKSYPAHRLVWLYENGYFPEHEIDHINRVKHDNRLENLRHVSHMCNSRNVGLSKNNKTGITGVRYDENKKKWISGIKVHYEDFYLGSFDRKIDAIKARWEAEKKHCWPDCNSTSTAFLYLKKFGYL